VDHAFEHVQRELRASRERGELFFIAWDRALAELPAPRADATLKRREHEQALEALAETRESWRRAYEGIPPTRPEVAATMLISALGDRVPLEEPVSEPALAAVA
jgi:hypothetical protein